MKKIEADINAMLNNKILEARVATWKQFRRACKYIIKKNPLKPYVSCKLLKNNTEYGDTCMECICPVLEDRKPECLFEQ